MNLLIGKFKLNASEIAVLTPYSAQREEIKKQLKLVEVKTITESQGQLMLVSSKVYLSLYSLQEVSME